MAPENNPRPPRWYATAFRILLVTFIVTLLCFAVILFLAIFGTVIHATLHGASPDMRVAYRHIALPLGAAAGIIIFLLVTIMEVRHHRQAKTLAAIERLS
jgi:hypothetical protein